MKPLILLKNEYDEYMPYYGTGLEEEKLKIEKFSKGKVPLSSIKANITSLG